MANISYLNINLFWTALAGTGFMSLIIEGRRMGMGKVLSHACLCQGGDK